MQAEEAEGVDHGRLSLVQMHPSHGSLLVEMAHEFHDEGDGRLDAVLADLDAFFRWVEELERGTDLPENRVPQTQYLHHPSQGAWTRRGPGMTRVRVGDGSLGVQRGELRALGSGAWGKSASSTAETSCL